MKLVSYFILLCFVTLPAFAAVVSSIGAFGSAQQVDVTSGNYLGWGYATDGLLAAPFFDNTQSGGVVPSITNNGFTASSRNYGHTFTFDDGTSLESGTNVVTSGNVARLVVGNSLVLTFSDIVRPQERILNLYLGGYRSGRAFSNFFINAAISGGGAPTENADQRSFGINQQRPNRVAVPFVYTLSFASDTATDLEVVFSISTAGGATRNFGVSGYTIEGPAPISVPATLPLTVAGVGAMAILRRRNLRTLERRCGLTV